LSKKRSIIEIVIGRFKISSMLPYLAVAVAVAVSVAVSVAVVLLEPLFLLFVPEF
jgi:hypothetical protein